MNKLPFAALFIVLILTLGCDSNPATFEESIPVYSLTTNVIPDEGGSIHPQGGEFRSGDNIEIEARAAEGYIFDRWEEDLSGNSNPVMLRFDSNRTVTAYFSRRDYNLNIEISGEGSVRETVAERSSEDEADSLGTSVKSVKLTAEAEDGWYFDRWEGDLRGSDNPEVISVDKEKNITAIFDREIEDGYTITIHTEGEGSVDKNPDRTYFAEGDEVILTANAESGWNFIEWRGDLSGRDNSQTIVIEGNIETTAVFGPFEDPFLEIAEQPSTTAAGRSITPAPEVKYIDELGDPVEGEEITVNLNQDSFASGSTTSAVTNEEGIAAFDNLIIETASTGYILTFESDESGASEISSKPFEIISAEADPSSSTADVPSDGSVGEETNIIINLADSFGNAVSRAADILSVEVSGANSANPSVSESGNGEYTASYTPTHAGSDQISISVNGDEIEESPFSSEIAAGSPAEMNITQQPSTVRAGSKISSAPAVRILDGFGNTLQDVEVSVELDGASFASGSTTSAETNSNGVVSFDDLVINTAGSGYSLIFEANGLEKTSDSFDVEPASADPSSSAADVPDGVTGEETVITINVEDRFGNSVSGSENDISIEVSGSNSTSATVSETSTSGEYSARYTPVRAGTDQIDVQIDGTSIGGSPFSSNVTAAEASPSNSMVTADPDALKSGESSTVTVEVRDNNDNPIGGLNADDFEIRLDGVASAESINETSTAGTYEFEVTSNEVGEVIVRVTVNGLTLDEAPLITFEAGDPDEIEIIVQPEDTQSGQPINGPPTVRVFDEFGQAVPDVDVRVREESGQEFSSGDLVVSTDESGIAEFSNLVIHTRVRWFYLVFSVDGVDEVDEVVSERFRVSFLDRSSTD